MEDLYAKLQQYAAADVYPFHMPGHKRQRPLVDRAYSIDITEIDDFDDLHHPTGLMKTAMEEAAQLYGSRRTFFLVNGSSCGILAAICAAVPVGGTLLMARHCHTSANHGVLLRHLRPIYLYPQVLPALGGICGAILPEQVEEALTVNPSIHAVLIVSPTYEGVVSDVAGIAAVCHRHGVPLLVDEAHGAHFSFGMGEFPRSAVQCGADVVVQSLHKTLPALTQTAVLHLCGDLISEAALKQYTDVFQSTSPSYVLMASVFACLRYMQAQAAEVMPCFAGRLRALRKEMVGIPGVSLLKESVIGAGAGYDISKLVFAVNGMSGQEVMQWLRKHAGLELEMAVPNYALAMTSLCDTEEGFARLLTALRQIPKDGHRAVASVSGRLPCTEMVFLPYEMEGCSGETVRLASAVGHIAMETVFLYPPGVPIVVAGERITEEISAQLAEAEARGFEVRGAEDHRPGTMQVLRSHNI